MVVTHSGSWNQIQVFCDSTAFLKKIKVKFTLFGVLFENSDKDI